MKRAVAILLVIVLLVGLSGCKEEPLKVTRVPICFDDPDESNVFHNVDIEWATYYEDGEINEIEMKLISNNSSLSGFSLLAYRREVNGGGRSIGAESDVGFYMMNGEITSFEIRNDEVSYSVKQKVTYSDGRQEDMEYSEQGIIEMERSIVDEQGNVLLMKSRCDDEELPVRYAEMDDCYPNWSYSQKKAVSLLAQEMVTEFLCIYGFVC